MLREQFPLYLAHIELILGCCLLHCGHPRVVSGGADLVEAASSVSGCSKLASWNTWCDLIRDDCVLPVLLRLVLEQGLVQILQIVPLWGVVVVAWVWISLVCRAGYEARSWSSWAKSCDLKEVSYQ